MSDMAQGHRIRLSQIPFSRAVVSSCVFKVTSQEYGKLETLPNDQMGMSGGWIRAKRGKSLLWLQLLSDDILLG